jgi:TolB protein
LNLIRRVSLALLIALPVIALAAACGGDDDDDSSPSASSTANTGAPTPSTSGGTEITPAPGAVGAEELQGKIVYTSTRSGNQDIWVMNADGSDQKNLTNTPDSEGFPEWSPDGEKIAFQRGFDLYLMNEDGSNVEMLVEGGADPGWSPDGEKIVFSLTDATTNPDSPRFDLAILDLESGEVTTLLGTDQFSEVYPAWSPDGETIVYFSDQDQALGLYSMDAGGGNVKQLTNTQTFDFYADWAPDGSKILFATPKGGIYNLVTISPDGSIRTDLTTPDTYDSFPAYSPDGCCIAFLSTRAAQSDIWVMRADGTGARQITSNPEEDGIQGLDWKP